MKWKGRRSSDNVNRGGSGGRIAGGIGGVGLIIMLLLAYISGQNPLEVLMDNVGSGGLTPQTTQQEEYVARNEEERELEEFLSVVLADTEDVWHDIFKQHGAEYREPKLTLYQNSTNTGCGFASANMGPFYCSADETIYIDVSFAKQLRSTFAAEGDFAFAYVLAHEVGHHVQKLIGTLQEVQSLKGQLSKTEFNKVMVMLELQADYYSGVFAHYVKNKGYLEAGDVEEGMAAASGVGDDRIKEMQGGRANPDTFQHGTSKQRQEWFVRGLEYGDLEHGNTFNSKELQ